MKCPVCKNISLTMSDRQGIEIDFCPDCRGVWLDRGELDKIIERSQNSNNLNNRISSQDNIPQSESRIFDQYKPKRKKSFLEEIFD
ncbi:MAG: zf-TFIIB domain-containing protein [Pseudobdellovibrio sp.]